MSKYLEGNKIKTEVKDYLIDKLVEIEGQNEETYGCDISNLLMIEDLENQCILDNYNDIKWIGNNFSDLGEILEEIKFQLGSDNIPNVFDKPEEFRLLVYSEVATYLLSECKYIDENWNDNIVLTDEVIEIIQKQLEEI